MNIPSYTPDKETLKKYADVFVKFALHQGAGVKPGEVVLIQVKDSARELALCLQQSVLEAGGHPILDYYLDGAEKEFYRYANKDQIDYRPDPLAKIKIELADHRIRVISELDLQNSAPIEKILQNKNRQSGNGFIYDMPGMIEKTLQNKLTRTLGLYPTESQATMAGMSLEEYWEQIKYACYLDTQDPVVEFKNTIQKINAVKKYLQSLDIQSIHLIGDDVDCHVKVGDNRKRLGGGTRNIPSFEVFITPDRRGTNGWIRFTEPLFYSGSTITGIQLRFENGHIIKSTADTNEEVLHAILRLPNADKIGEFSLTDRTLSRISRFMATTLYDENVGGRYGNTHMAIGWSFKDSYQGDTSLLKTPEDWQNIGYNQSSIHLDIVSTSNRTAIATLPDGSEKCIYQNGEFVM